VGRLSFQASPRSHLLIPKLGLGTRRHIRKRPVAVLPLR
jgi:hypothetical protein